VKQNEEEIVVPAEPADSLSASLEDYLEAILNLSSEANVARSKHIAELLGVSRASVTGALRVLKKKGLANYKPYDYVTLTEPGRAAAAEIARKHGILKSFFVNVLGVEAELAQQAACRAEHALGAGIISRLMSFIEFVTHSGRNGYDLVELFQEFCKNSNSAQERTDT
jgi:DtxR family Mn-dependent transcriptional regulator